MTGKQVPDHYGDVGPGWWALLTALHHELMASDPGYSVLQVKEKFGTLRVYPDGRDIQEIIGKYEEMSSYTCEDCGKLGSLDGTRYWLRTLCAEHAAARWLRRSPDARG